MLFEVETRVQYSIQHVLVCTNIRGHWRPYEILYIPGFENRKHTKFQFNWPISFRDIYFNMYISGDLVAQAVRCLPPTTGVPSSHLGPSMWVSWWMKRGLGRFFLGFLPFSPTTNFIPPFLHTRLIHFFSYHPPL